MDYLCACGRAGQALHYCIRILHLHSPPKNPPLQNLRLLNFANLTLHAREARGVPENPWHSVATATERASETDLVSRLVSIYSAARTHFSTNP